MVHYLYDGTFEGLLTVVATAIAQERTVAAITAAAPVQPDLFVEYVTVTTEPDRATELFARLQAEFIAASLEFIGYSFLTEQPGIEKAIFDYIRLLFATRGQAARNFADPAVFRLQRASQQVFHEIHRLHGFVRFRKLNNGLFYAPIEPDYAVVQFLAPHFTARFADQSWLIHDRKRNQGIYYNQRHCRYLSEVGAVFANGAPEGESHGLAPFGYEVDEQDFQQLWNEYFHHIAIAERENRRAQRQRMPERYWRCLVEDVNGTKNCPKPVG